MAGRWHEAGAAVIYASENYATAMLEKLVQWNGVLPANQHFVKITIPRGTSYEVATPDILTGWDSQDCLVSRSFAKAWYEEGRSAILIVPSIVARMERNVVINSLHLEFPDLQVSLETPVRWDRRLFQLS